MMVEGAASRDPLVRFRIGAAGTGKTRRFLDDLIRFEAEGRSAFYLVPEQSTYVADRLILEPPGPEAIRHVRAVSFRRLAWIVDDTPAGVVPRETVLDASGRRILLRSVFSQLEPRLRAPFQSLLDRPGFVESLTSVLRDLRFEAGPGVDAWLAGAGRDAAIPADLETKIEAIAALRAAYDRALIHRGLRDPERLLQETPERIARRSDLFRGVPLLIDGFSSFTRLESEILIGLARVRAEIEISLCCAPDLIELADSVRPSSPSLRIQEWPAGIHRSVRPVFLASFRTLCELRERFRASGIATRCEPVGQATPAAKATAIFPATPVPPRFTASPDLARLEAALLSRSKGSGGSPAGPPRDVSLAAARDPSHEVETWARQIDRWSRCGPRPIRFGEIAVIVRDLEMYRPIVEETFARYRIPVFVDRHWDIGSRPLVRTVLDALEVLLSGWQREAVIAFLRSPLLGARQGEVDLIENLSLEAGLDYEKWTGPPWEPLRRPPRTHYWGRRDFERESAETGGEPDARGGEDAEDADDSREDRIERTRVGIANRIRSAILDPLKEFERTWGKKEGITGKEAVAALRRWCASSGIYERALAGTGAGTSAGTGAGARAVTPPADAAREVEAFDHVCDQVASETGDERIAIETFARLLGAGLGTLKLGRTPTGLDRVTIAEIQRSRVGEVKRAIVGGLCARDFPRGAEAGRFFSEPERASLARLGLDLGTPAPMRQEEEGYFLYIALTRAREGLLLTRPTLDLEGKPLEASPFIQEIRAALPGLTEEIPSLEESPADLRDAQTSDEIAARVGAYIASRLDRRRAGRSADPDPGIASRGDRNILTAYNRLIVPESRGRRPLEESSRLWGYDNRPRLPRAVIAAALGPGGRIATSAGRLETYAQCAYRHFARHMLRLEERSRAEVTPLENGLLAHRALEVLYREGIPPAERPLIKERLEDVFRRIEGDDRLKAYRVDPSGGFRWRNARGELRRFLEIEARRLARSAFRPYLFEQEFGTQDIPPLRIPLPGGGEVLLRGRIDRIDVLEPRGEGKPEALVIDYKSRIAPGQGRPALVEDGLDLQLAVYMLVASEILGLDPVGALYAPVLPKPKAERSRDPENPLDIRMVGLLPESDRERFTGGIGIIQGARRKLRDRSELQGVLEKAREMIIRHACEIMDGRIDVAPVQVGRLPCDHCEFAGLCRVDRSYNPSRTPSHRS